MSNYIDVKLEKGTIKFVKVNPNGEETTCDYCPYGINTCRYIPNPLRREDKSDNFSTFCNTVEGKTVEETNRLRECVPDFGSIEELLKLKNVNVKKDMIEENIYISEEKVINSICKGNCPMFNEEHTNCTKDNPMCIISELFEKK